MHFRSSEHATVFKSVQPKSCFECAVSLNQAIYNAQLLSLHNVMSVLLLSKCCRCNVCFKIALDCMDERCAGVMLQFKGTEEAEVGFDNRHLMSDSAAMFCRLQCFATFRQVLQHGLSALSFNNINEHSVGMIFTRLALCKGSLKFMSPQSCKAAPCNQYILEKSRPQRSGFAGR